MKTFTNRIFIHRPGFFFFMLLYFSINLHAQENGYDRWELIDNGKLVVSSLEDNLANKDLSFPSVIKIPSWATHRANPNANYYMYYAEHHGDYIRMKWAENIEGPWTEYNHNGVGGNGRNLRGVMDFYADDYRDEFPFTNDSGFYNNNNSWKEDWYTGGHIAAPDIFLDEENQIFIMAWHGKTGHNGSPIDDNGRVITFRHSGYIAFSKDGLNFNDPVTGGGQSGTWGAENMPYGPLENHTTKNGVPMEITQVFFDDYARLFFMKGQFWAICSNGRLWKPRDPKNPWKVPQELIDTNDSFNFWWEVQATNENDLWRSNDPNILELQQRWAYESHLTTWFVSKEFENHPNNPYPGHAIIRDFGGPKVNHPEVHVLSEDRIEVFIYIRSDKAPYYSKDDPWRDVMRVELDCSAENWDDWQVATHSETGLPVFDVVITPEAFKEAVEEANGGDVDGTVFADPVSMGNPGYYEENGNKYLFCGFKSKDVNPTFNHSEGQIAPVKIYSKANGLSVQDNTDINFSNTFRVFPNPATSNIYIHAPQAASIAIINLQGITLLQTKVTDNTIIDVSGFNSGAYIIQAKFKNTTLTKKWIKL